METGNLSREELLDLENARKTPRERAVDHAVCLLPVLVGMGGILEYLYVPNRPGYRTTFVYVWFLGALVALSLAGVLLTFCSGRTMRHIRHKAPFHVLIYLLFIGYDLLTDKSASLMMPFFPSVDQVLNAILSDGAYLFDCTWHSLILLFTGYAIGLVVGLATGIACGYSRRINYWISPFTRLLGAIPSTTWIPVVMVLAMSLFQGAVFIIALGVWFAITVSTITGIRTIDRSYYEAARILGASSRQLVTHVSIPSALPSIFQGMTQAMSSACTALIVAEMIGVQSGLGWYITWQKNWAEYDKMYGAIVVICLIFVAVNFLLERIRRRVLVWQEGMVEER